MTASNKPQEHTYNILTQEWIDCIIKNGHKMAADADFLKEVRSRVHPDRAIAENVKLIDLETKVDCSVLEQQEAALTQLLEWRAKQNAQHEAFISDLKKIL